MNERTDGNYEVLPMNVYYEITNVDELSAQDKTTLIAHCNKGDYNATMSDYMTLRVDYYGKETIDFLEYLLKANVSDWKQATLYKYVTELEEEHIIREWVRD